ncbi:type II secretion system protein GspL [Ramlibacter tataouinensis]|uniref:Candidate general secretion pathway protein L, component of type II secretion system n=1 Tax=Ramlibacter tataouinensis (strain ATCC BAA-407 / DSM 14655 / LMG 21543 / TTB310) TaxID=365046 RepID=F5Y0Q7_RAMTT|nr:type II secretion system protein GspL [Ramlibacter tataouinensis]AEG94651.1 candidate general secretion pathway protein L, component of type II secretion system [Ramlibacter tataouinensis TTB310]
MSSLFVLLPTEPATAGTEFGFVLTPDGQTVGEHGSAPAALLPAPAGAAAEVVAVVPAAALSWHQVELPKGLSAASPRLRAVLEGLLEERLLDEPEALHFALQPQPPAGAPAWVAVCERAWLRAGVQALEAAGRPVGRIVPEFTPQDPPAVHAIGEPESALLVAASAGGVLALPLTAASLPLLPALPEHSVCTAEPAVAAQAEQLLQQPVTLQLPAQRWLLAAQSRWDLAQFDFASSLRARRLKKLATGGAELLRAPQWRPARWGAALLVAANLVGLNAWAWKERAALDDKRERVREVLTQTFPQVKVVVDAPVQMEREVAALRRATGASSGRDLEAMLSALASLGAGQPAGGIEYNGSELRVKGLGWNTEQARRAAASLKGQGYAVALQGDTLVVSPEALP